jgi:beta-phosphoglucomutase
MSKIQGVIFDLDGVLVSTDDLHYIAWKKIADKESIYFDQEINHQLRGVSRKESLEIILKNSDKVYSEEVKQLLLKEKNDTYIELLDQLDEKNLLVGALEVLDALVAQKIKIAIGSSSRNAKTILNKLGLTHYFDTIVDGTHIKNSKPDPEVFLKAASQLNLAVNQCVVVEDSFAGVEAAHRAQIKSYYLKGKTMTSLNTVKIKDLTEILKDI